MGRVKIPYNTLINNGKTKKFPFEVYGYGVKVYVYGEIEIIC